MSREQQLEHLIKNHTENLLRIAYYYTKNAQSAEDIVQDVFITFHFKANYVEQGELGAYLAKMTINKSKDYLKSWTYRTHVLKDKFEIFKRTTQEKELVTRQEQQLIEQAILALPLKWREPIMYFYFEEMKIKDIADLLEIPESTVKTRLKKAKQLLKNELANEDWEVLTHDEETIVRD